MDSTKILIMDDGENKQFDKPTKLFQEDASLFSSMVDACGEEQSKNLRKIAEDLEIKRKYFLMDKY